MGKLLNWYTATVDLNHKTDLKLVSSKYHQFSQINKEKFQKDLMHLVDIEVLTQIHHYEYSIQFFTITNK